MVGKVTAKPTKFLFVNEKAEEPGGSREHETLKLRP